MKRQNQSGFAHMLIFAVIILLAIGGAGYFVLGKNKDKSTQPSTSKEEVVVFDENNLPKFIQADFIDLDRIYDISKFRSAAGHDFSEASGESCRSMKHYFSPPPTTNKSAAKEASLKNQKAPAPDPTTAINIYSPVAGTITRLEELPTTGSDIIIKPDSQPAYAVRIAHSFPVGWLEVGDKVKAGQKLAIIGNDQDVDMIIEYGQQNQPGSFRYVSYFSVMSDSVFKQYQARGVSSPADLIITKEYRDAHPLKCESVHGNFSSSNDLSDPMEANVKLN